MKSTLRTHKRILFTLLLPLFFASCTEDEIEEEGPILISPVYNPNNNVTSSNYQNGTLNFTAGENTPSDATYKLYLDTTQNPTTSYNLSTNRYNYSNLIANTNYYWKVETLNNLGTVLATSSIFNFTTGLIYNGSLSLTQEQIDTFEYTKVTGDLSIEGFDNNSITNLKGLTSLSSIGGDFEIWLNRDLETLEGLESLTSIGGNLYILQNYALNSLNALEGVTSIGGTLTFNDNDALISLDGLSSLITVGGSLRVFWNDALTSFNGLDSLTSVTANLEIWDNDNLINLNGLETLTTLGGNLYIGRNTNSSSSGIGNNVLINLCGVSQLIVNGQISNEEYFVGTNAHNPTYTEIQSTGSGGCER